MWVCSRLDALARPVAQYVKYGEPPWISEMYGYVFAAAEQQIDTKLLQGLVEGTAAIVREVERVGDPAGIEADDGGGCSERLQRAADGGRGDVAGG